MQVSASRSLMQVYTSLCKITHASLCIQISACVRASDHMTRRAVHQQSSVLPEPACCIRQASADPIPQRMQSSSLLGIAHLAATKTITSLPSLVARLLLLLLLPCAAHCARRLGSFNTTSTVTVTVTCTGTASAPQALGAWAISTPPAQPDKKTGTSTCTSDAPAAATIDDCLLRSRTGRDNTPVISCSSDARCALSNRRDNQTQTGSDTGRVTTIRRAMRLFAQVRCGWQHPQRTLPPLVQTQTVKPGQTCQNSNEAECIDQRAQPANERESGKQWPRFTKQTAQQAERCRRADCGAHAEPPCKSMRTQHTKQYASSRQRRGSGAQEISVLQVECTSGQRCSLRNTPVREARQCYMRGHGSRQPEQDTARTACRRRSFLQACCPGGPI